MKKLIAFILVFAGLVIAQQPAPTTYRLNAEASKALMDIEAVKDGCIKSAAERQHWILVGAGVPEDSRQCSRGQDGIVVCVKPETAKVK